MDKLKDTHLLHALTGKVYLHNLRPCPNCEANLHPKDLRLQEARCVIAHLQAILPEDD